MAEVPITVLMPVYNGSEYLDKSVASILEQAYTDFQFLIVDDGSHDATPEMLKSYQASDSRVEVVRNRTNIGLTKSLNKGLALSKGEYIARMDCDDISLPGRFQAQIDFLKTNPDMAMVGVAWKEMNSNLEKTLRTMRPPTRYERIRRSILSRNLFCHSAVMMRRRPLKEVGGYDEQDMYSQDYDLWLRLITRYPVANLPGIYHLRRVHDQNLSQKNIRKQLKTMARSQSRYIKRANMSPFYYAYVQKSLFLSCLPVWALTLLSRLNRKRSPF
jgi:glycosyltransferase involved in cell wall biosynthesis